MKHRYKVLLHAIWFTLSCMEATLLTIENHFMSRGKKYGNNNKTQYIETNSNIIAEI